MRSLVLLSGGVDSSVALARTWQRAVDLDLPRPIALFLRYGQKHERREWWSFFQIAHFYGAERCEEELSPSLLAGSALTGTGDVPRGYHYADPQQRATVVGGRNLLMISAAVCVAVRKGCNRVVIGAHKGDEAVYADCRGEFIRAAGRAAELGYGVTVEAPFSTLHKKDIVELGHRLGVPLDMTWSCYEGGARPCGECGACVERLEAEEACGYLSADQRCRAPA